MKIFRDRYKQTFGFDYNLAFDDYDNDLIRKSELMFLLELTDLEFKNEYNKYIDRKVTKFRNEKKILQDSGIESNSTQ